MDAQPSTVRISRQPASSEQAAALCEHASVSDSAKHYYIHEKRINDLERDVEKHDMWLSRIEERLARGEVNFTELRKDLEKLAEELRGIRSTLTNIGMVIIIGVLGVAGSALIWVLSHMKHM